MTLQPQKQPYSKYSPKILTGALKAVMATSAVMLMVTIASPLFLSQHFLTNGMMITSKEYMRVDTQF